MPEICVHVTSASLTNNKKLLVSIGPSDHWREEGFTGHDSRPMASEAGPPQHRDRDRERT